MFQLLWNSPPFANFVIQLKYKKFDQRIPFEEESRRHLMTEA